jgi:hypothetical protein
MVFLFNSEYANNLEEIEKELTTLQSNVNTEGRRLTQEAFSNVMESNFKINQNSNISMERLVIPKFNLKINHQTIS